MATAFWSAAFQRRFLWGAAPSGEKKESGDESPHSKTATRTSMNQADAFVQAILDDPDDDSLRLIYADWLEERGDPRGEFIRVQYALAGMDADDPRRPPLEARERTLLKEHGVVWAGPLPRLVEDYAFGRGFVEKVTLNASCFVERGPEIFCLAPVQTVRLNRGSMYLPAVANVPHLGRVRGLDLRYLHLFQAPDALGRLLESHYLERLTSLDLTSNHITGRAVVMLPDSSRMSGITALHLGVNSIGIHDLFPIRISSYFTCLAILDLSGNPLGDGGARALMAPGYLALCDLNLSGTGISDEGVHWLATSRHLAGLEKLDLRFNQIGDAGVQVLAAAPTLGKLRVLKLGYNPVGTPGVRALASSPHMAQLTTLDLRRSRVANNAAQALIESPYLSRLWRLDLRGNDISQRHCEALRERFGKAVHLS
jgi:uncharacterized protein (TIGR02996 family)